jgi:hypothetical protein
MRYLFVFLAIIAVWIGVICVSTLPQTTDSRFSLYIAALAGTVTLFLIGFWRRTS